MSKYTTEVRFICENYAGLQDSTSNYRDVIEKSRAKVFDFDFPIYDESYRSVLETKILKHFYTREIGFETVGLWKLWMDKRLNEIMPYYNQLYKSATLEFNPFYDFDYTTTSNRKVNGNDDKSSDYTRTDNLSEVTNGSSNQTRTDGLTEQVNKTVGSTRTDDLTKTTNGTTSGNNSNTRKDNTTVTTSNKNRYSDTPQGSLQNIENNTYLTNATLDDGSNKTNGTVTDEGKNSGKYDDTVKNTGTQSNNEITQGTKRNSGTQQNDETTSGSKNNTGTQKNDGTENRVYSNTDDYLEHVAGKRNGISYSNLLQEYRRTFLNIDMMIIDELNDLFMNLW